MESYLVFVIIIMAGLLYMEMNKKTTPPTVIIKSDSDQSDSEDESTNINNNLPQHPTNAFQPIIPHAYNPMYYSYAAPLGRPVITYPNYPFRRLRRKLRRRNRLHRRGSRLLR
jgi:hypothetical protein